MNRNQEPTREQMAGLPLEIQVAVLYERVGTLKDEVKALKRAVWSAVASIIGGAVLFLFSLASGWIGPKAPTAHVAMAVWRFLT